MKKIVIILLIQSLLLNTTVLSITINENRNTIYVDDDNTQGPWDGSLEHPFNKIQDGVHAASSGDTIFVFNGLYGVSDSDDIVIDESINLIGENKDATIISATGFDDYVIKIISDHVKVSGFTIRNAIRGIICNTNFSTINGNCIIDQCDGILISESSNNIISENAIISNMNGITIQYSSVKNNISLNNISDNIRGVEVGSLCNENIIFKNIIAENGETGLLIYGSDNNIVLNNTICENSYYICGSGIHLGKSSYNNITGNVISNNYDSGICLTEFSGNNIISENVIKNNRFNDGIISFGIHIVYSSNDNIIFHNDFINNYWFIFHRNAYDVCCNIWYNSTIKEGNYWDNYKGKDSSGDGIGDLAYSISGGSNKDLYPLMEPNNCKSRVRTIDRPLLIFLQRLLQKIFSYNYR